MQRFKHYHRFLFSAGFSAVAILFSVVPLFAQVYPVDTIIKNGERPNRINLVYLSDGYQASELNKFNTDALAINDALFSQTPFAEYKNFFNVFTVKVPSNQSGAKHPGNATDEVTSGNQPVINPDNYFQSTFDYFLIHRLLFPQNGFAINSVLASNLPDYDQAFMVVNSPYYGGSGGAYATASTDPSSAEVAIHEIGHSFAGLSDEYWAGEFYASESPNMTQDNNPATIKWKNWLNINNVGIYPYGVVPPENTWYRPHQFCKMQYLGYPFCSVCTERFVDRMHELVNMIDTYSPSATAITLTDTDDVAFSITDVRAVPSTTTVNWYLNGNIITAASGMNTVNIPFSSFANGNNTVTAEVVDNTALSKSYLPTAGYINSLTWTVNTGVLPVVLDYFRGSISAQQQGVLEWQVANTATLKGFDLERSRDGISYTKIATINGGPGKKMYSYTDPHLLAPYNYYRLVLKDKDGSSTYSSILKLSNPFDKLYYKVYQNDDAHTYHLTCMLTNEAGVQADITTAGGTAIFRKDFGKKNGQFDYDFNLAGKAGGIYFLNVYIDGRKHTVKLLAK